MEIDKYFSGNCKINVLYGLGTAEDENTAEDFFHFLHQINKEIKNNGGWGHLDPLILATTNDEQYQERKWLEQAGFQTHHIEGFEFQIHTISKVNLKETLRIHKKDIEEPKKLQRPRIKRNG
jgi:hypothetical protein